MSLDKTYLNTEIQGSGAVSRVVKQINYQPTLKFLWPCHIGIKRYESQKFEKESKFESPHALFLQARPHIMHDVHPM